MASLGIALGRMAGIGLIVLCAWLPANAATPDNLGLSPKIHEVIGQMGSDDPMEVETAQLRLAALPPDLFPLIQEVAARGSFTPQATERIKAFIERQLPFQAPRKRILESQRAIGAWNRGWALASYEKNGRKNPKWDNDVRVAIDYATGLGVNWTAARDAAERAIKNGCRFPYVYYVQGLALEKLQAPHLQSAGPYSGAATQVMAGDFPAIMKMQCYVARSKLQKYRIVFSAIVPKSPQITACDLAIEQWPAVLKENVPPAVLEELATTLTGAQPAALRKATFDAIYTPWQAAQPDCPEILTYKGNFYADYAWDARGGDWAQNVTQEGWKSFFERLTIAETALTAAWEKDHNSAGAATTMLKVELGQGKGRARMETWFRRAMDANPDNREACTRKMLYLEPKWHGTMDDMINFARECKAGQNWRGFIPFAVENTYQEMLPYLKDPQTFFSTPAVWNDIDSLYVPYLRVYPANTTARNNYTRFACLAGKWDIARQQFDLLGNKANPKSYGGEEILKQYQAMAREKGTAAPAR